MKRFFLICIVVVMAVALASPAMAGLKLTSKGRMDVTGIWMSGNFVDVWAGGTAFRANMDQPNDWFQQELVIDPVLHINEKVRIHARITMLETVWGIAGGPFPNTGFEANYRGATNFWVERLYLSFPLFGGTFYAGRMAGGAFGYPFHDGDNNSDRLKYVRGIGPAVFVAVYEKIHEGDTRNVWIQAPQTGAPAQGDPWTIGGPDNDLYAMALVMPWSKNPLIVTKTLLVLIDFNTLGTNLGRAEGMDFIWTQTVMIKAGIFLFETEWRFRNRNIDDGVVRSPDDSADWHVNHFSIWGEAGLHPGPFSFVLGGFWLQGSASQDPGSNRSIQATGAEFEPLLLLFSEDMGALWNTTGVNNNSAGTSGYKMGYFRAAYKINDTMSLSGIVGFLWADKMLYFPAGSARREKGTTPDTFIGWEIDIGFRWAFMDNIAYVVEGAFLKPGPYVNGVTGFNADRTVYGVRHMLVINW